MDNQNSSKEKVQVKIPNQMEVTLFTKILIVAVLLIIMVLAIFLISSRITTTSENEIINLSEEAVKEPPIIPFISEFNENDTIKDELIKSCLCIKDLNIDECNMIESEELRKESLVSYWFKHVIIEKDTSYCTNLDDPNFCVNEYQLIANNNCDLASDEVTKQLCYAWSEQNQEYCYNIESENVNLTFNCLNMFENSSIDCFSDIKKVNLLLV